MRRARLRIGGDTPAAPGLTQIVPVREIDGAWYEVADEWAAVSPLTGRYWPLEGAVLAAPSDPRVILGMAHNGSAADRAIPRQAFMKSARSAIGSGEPIRIVPGHGNVVAEAELAVVIGVHCRNVSAREAADVIAGYTIGNDVTATDQIALDEKMIQSKSGDGFTPLGPWLVSDLDPDSVPLELLVNGELRCQSDTDRLAWNIAEQIEYLSEYMTLGPGDVILTGSPETASPIKPGDTVRAALDGIGILENPVIAL